MRWPEPFPFDSSLAMRVATYATSIGRAVPFAQAAFRQAFAGGHSLEDPDFVLIAAAACEMHPTAVLRGAELRSVSDAARGRHRGGGRRGVTDVPAVVVGGATCSSASGRSSGRRRTCAASRRTRERASGRDPIDMKAGHAYRLIVTRGGRAPALLADTARVDHIEVVEIDSGEVVLFWDRPPQAASKLARALRADLAQLDAEEFMARWSTVEH